VSFSEETLSPSGELAESPPESERNASIPPIPRASPIKKMTLVRIIVESILREIEWGKRIMFH
jgi:hypothetical protein